MKKEFLQNKAGVSLITVLLFMLVATIAATATWKFITSEGFSSTSRMLKREAFQSAQAGIENARSWMTFHANDVGGLIKQFQDNNGQPVNIDNQLRTLQRAGQNYHVWLTGVNTSNSTYKLKILSSGEARNNTRHTEVAIFNVDGLYQVEVPKEKVQKSIDFEYAYYGGTIYYEGSNDVSSMVVNGNWNHNPPKTTSGDFIITGNAGLSGNEINVAKTTCIGGNLSGMWEYGNYFKFNGIRTKNLYIGGDALDFIGIVDSNAYFDGKVELGSSCGEFKFQVKGNMTVADTIKLNHCGQTMNERYVNGNTCVIVSEDGTKSGQIRTDGNYVELKGSTWMAAPYSIWPVEDDRNYYSNYERFIVGNASDDDIYIKNAKPWSFYNTNRIAKTFNEGTAEFEPNMTCANGTSGMQTCSEWGTCKGAFGRSYKCCKSYTESSNCGSWKTWAAGTYSPYPEKAAKENLYLLFNDDIQDVNFLSHYNEYWKADVSSYYVGEALFFDLWSVWNEYNYEDGKATGSPYCKKQGNFANGSQDVAAHRPSCDVKPWFKVDGSLKEWTDEKPITCAEKVKNHCFEVWEEGQGCDGAKYIVKDPLKVAIDSIDKYANKAPCAAAIANLTGNDLLDYDMKNGEKSLSKCYNDASDHDKTAEEKWLYNGYLVVDLPTEGIFKSPKNKLDGKFVIIIDSPGPNAESIKLPPTNDNDDFVFLYLPEGYKQTNTYFGHEVVNNNSQIYLEGNGNFNYFIFSKKDIYGVQGKNNTLSGSIYLQLKDEQTGAATCAKLDHLWSANLQYNSALMKSLYNNGIICPNDGSQCGGTDPTPASSSSNAADGSSSSNGGGDRFYISMAPQLGVSLESQSKSFENVENLQKEDGSSPLTPSFVILPRIVSLPNDPYGSLGDYLNVISLNLPQNGTPLAKTSLSLGSCVTISGNGSLGVSSLSSQLYTPGGEKLPKGSYKCEITASSDDPLVTMPSDPVPVWIVVNDQEMRSMHKIAFAAASQDIGSTGSKDVIVRLQPNIPSVQLNVSCPNPPSQWEYADLPSGVSVGGTCKFTVSNTENTEKLVKLFSVKTTDATSGTMNFQILPGEDYTLDYPYISSIYMSSVASLYRDNVSSEHVNSYCENHANLCPTTGWRDYWPDCEKLGSNDVWVAPDGAGFKTEIINDAWLITSAINTTVKLKDVSNGKCVVVIPDNESCTFSDTQKSCTLHASAKKKVHRIKFEFKNVESGTNPFFMVKSGGQIKTYFYNNDLNYPECITNAYGVHECTVNVYDGDSVSMKIETSLEANQDFRYWRCEGASCPDHSKLNSDTYPPFVLSENGSVVTVMFNEVDKHCFFEKFKSSAIACGNLRDDERKEYCIDTCDASGKCGLNYSDAKWILVKRSAMLTNEDVLTEVIDYSNGKIAIKNMKDVNSRINGRARTNISITVMSTINADAGTHGTLKALVRLPKKSNEPSTRIKSGFLLGSDAMANRYLSLHMFIDDDGYVKAEVCNESGDACQEESLTITASEEDLVMIEAIISADEITVSASKTNETSKVTIKFSLAYWEGSYQGSHVGYRISSPKFVLYGIGWKSENYECFNTYPTIKCSFNAVAQDGVVPKEQYVKPWIGYSGWEGWDRSDCAEKYYYKGDDACGGYADGYTTCDDYGYYFNATSSGKHGYTDDGNDVRTAKVGLECSSNFNSYSIEEMLWASDSAHCGVFWTGSQNSCTTIEKITDIEISGLSEKSAAFKENGSTVNLRDTRILVETDIPKESEIWLWLSSEGHDGSEYRSEHVSITARSKEFAIEAFMSESGGFDPGKVRGVYFENKGSDEVTIQSLRSECKTAVKVKRCSVEEKSVENSGISWIFGPPHTRIVEITATVNNREYAENYQVIAQKKEELPKSSVFDKDNDKVTTEDEDKVIISLGKGPGKLADGPFKELKFFMSVKPDDAGYSDTIPCQKTGEMPKCKIEQPKNNEEKDQDKVEFRAVLEHCDGCSYVVEFDGTNKKQDDCSHDRCEINIPKGEFTSLTIGNEYLFTLSSPNDEFEPCSSKVKIKAAPGLSSSSETSSSSEVSSSSVVSSSSEVSSSSITSSSSSVATVDVVCPETITGKKPEDKIDVNATIKNCPTSDCKIDIFYGSTVKNSGNELYFYDDPGDDDQRTYTLKATSNGTSKTCTFNVTFVKPEIECPADINNQNPSNAISITGASVQNCAPCTFKVLLGISEKTFGSNLNSLSFTETAANATGEQTYTIKAIDSYDRTGSCTFKVTFSGSSDVESVTFTYQGSAEVFKPGKTYTVNCSPLDKGSLICTAPKGGTEIYINNVKKFTSFNWQEGQYPEGYQSVDQCSNIKNAKVTVTDDMKCRTDW